jgi:nucleoside-diphosphate-sugar epimerase
MKVIVTGATSQIGHFLLPRLVAEGHQVIAVSRHPGYSAMDGIEWIEADIAQAAAFACPEATTLIHIAPIRLLPDLLPAFFARGGRRIVCIGTTSRHSKQGSANAYEQAFAAAQMAAEDQIAQLCAAADANWTVLRPTLIYGCGRDRNVTLIARSIRRFGFFPLFGDASGLRQPIHADDIAMACVAVIDNPDCLDKAYDLTGGETLTYRAMVTRIFQALGRPPRFFRVPLWLLRGALALVSILPRYRDFNGEMARRMNEDLVFDSGSARDDFGYAPRSFQPETFDPPA